MTGARAHAAGVRSVRANVVRRLNQAVLALAVLVTLICGAMVAAAAVDDARIARDRAVATADVTSVNTLRTYVRFRDEQGNYHQPSVGLKYPTGLVAGQQATVEYQAANPENVKVQGRSWTLAVLPALSSLAVALTVVGVLWLGVRRLGRRLGVQAGVGADAGSLDAG